MRESILDRIPVYRRFLFDGAIQVTVFGAARNWNYAGATPSEIEAGNPGIIADLSTVIDALRINRALVPKPAFNARVVSASDLTNEILPGFFRGADADGVIVERKDDAYFLASADCLTTVIYDPRSHRLAALHCGRNALLDRAALDGAQKRPYESVVLAALQKLNVTRGNANDLGIFLAAGIGPKTFTHPTTQTIQGPDGQPIPNKYREANQRMIAHLQNLWETTIHESHRWPVVIDPELGTIDLVSLVSIQLVSRGVPLGQIMWDGHDTATDFDAEGNFLFHSKRRDPKQRNLIVVQLM